MTRGMYVCIFGFKGASTSQVIGARNEMMDDYDGQMIFGDLVGLKLPWHSSYRWGKTPKKPPRKLVPTGDRTRARCVTSAHATTCSTAVDMTRGFWITLYCSSTVLPLFFTRLTSWESARKIIAWYRNISPLYPLHPSLAHSFSCHWGINLKQRYSLFR